MFLDIVIAYQDYDIDRWEPCHSCTSRGCFHIRSLEERATFALRYQRSRLQVFRKVRGVREFWLVLCADVLDPMVKYAIGVLERLVKTEKRLDYFLRKPLIVAEMRSRRTSTHDVRAGVLLKCSVLASAL